MVGVHFHLKTFPSTLDTSRKIVDSWSTLCRSTAFYLPWYRNPMYIELVRFESLRQHLLGRAPQENNLCSCFTAVTILRRVFVGQIRISSAVQQVYLDVQIIYAFLNASRAYWSGFLLSIERGNLRVHSEDFQCISSLFTKEYRGMSIAAPAGGSTHTQTRTQTHVSIYTP